MRGVQIAALGVAVCSTYIIGRAMRSAMEGPSSATASADAARLGRILGVSPRKLRLDPFMQQMASRVLDPREIDVELDDVAGLDSIIQQLRSEDEFVRAFPGAHSASMLSGSKGVLMYGPPGTGKTMVAKVCNRQTLADGPGRPRN